MTLTNDEITTINECIRTTLDNYFNGKNTFIGIETMINYKDVIFDTNLLAKKISDKFINKFEENIKFIQEKYPTLSIKYVWEKCNKIYLLHRKFESEITDDELKLFKNKKYMDDSKIGWQFIKNNFFYDAYVDFMATGESGFSSCDVFGNILFKNPKIVNIFKKYNLYIF